MKDTARKLLERCWDEWASNTDEHDDPVTQQLAKDLREFLDAPQQQGGVCRHNGFSHTRNVDCPRTYPLDPDTAEDPCEDCGRDERKHEIGPRVAPKSQPCPCGAAPPSPAEKLPPLCPVCRCFPCLKTHR